MTAARVTAILLLAAGALALARGQSPPAASRSGQTVPAPASRPVARVPHAATAPAIDGRLDDGVWARAGRLVFDRTLERGATIGQG